MPAPLSLLIHSNPLSEGKEDQLHLNDRDRDVEQRRGSIDGNGVLIEEGGDGSGDGDGQGQSPKTIKEVGMRKDDGVESEKPFNLTMSLSFNTDLSPKSLPSNHPISPRSYSQPYAYSYSHKPLNLPNAILSRRLSPPRIPSRPLPPPNTSSKRPPFDLGASILPAPKLGSGSRPGSSAGGGDITSNSIWGNASARTSFPEGEDGDRERSRRVIGLGEAGSLVLSPPPPPSTPETSLVQKEMERYRISKMKANKEVGMNYGQGNGAFRSSDANRDGERYRRGMNGRPLAPKPPLPLQSSSSLSTAPPSLPNGSNGRSRASIPSTPQRRTSSSSSRVYNSPSGVGVNGIGTGRRLSSIMESEINTNNSSRRNSNSNNNINSLPSTPPRPTTSNGDGTAMLATSIRASSVTLTPPITSYQTEKRMSPGQRVVGGDRRGSGSGAVVTGSGKGDGRFGKSYNPILQQDQHSSHPTGRSSIVSPPQNLPPPQQPPKRTRPPKEYQHRKPTVSYQKDPIVYEHKRLYPVPSITSSSTRGSFGSNSSRGSNELSDAGSPDEAEISRRNFSTETDITRTGHTVGSKQLKISNFMDLSMNVNQVTRAGKDSVVDKNVDMDRMDNREKGIKRVGASEEEELLRKQKKARVGVEDGRASRRGSGLDIRMDMYRRGSGDMRLSQREVNSSTRPPQSDLYQAQPEVLNPDPTLYPAPRLLNDSQQPLEKYSFPRPESQPKSPPSMEVIAPYTAAFLEAERRQESRYNTLPYPSESTPGGTDRNKQQPQRKGSGSRNRSDNFLPSKSQQHFLNIQTIVPYSSNPPSREGRRKKVADGSTENGQSLVGKARKSIDQGFRDHQPKPYKRKISPVPERRPPRELNIITQHPEARNRSDWPTHDILPSMDPHARHQYWRPPNNDTWPNESSRRHALHVDGQFLDHEAKDRAARERVRMGERLRILNDQARAAATYQAEPAVTSSSPTKPFGFASSSNSRLAPSYNSSLPDPNTRRSSIKDLPRISIPENHAGHSRQMQWSATSSTQSGYQPCMDKPDVPYSRLIHYAIMGSPRKKLTLAQIYEAIEEVFPYFRSPDCPEKWKNNIRHNLSISNIFIKEERSDGEAGPGCYWTINPIASWATEGKLISPAAIVAPSEADEIRGGRRTARSMSA